MIADCNPGELAEEAKKFEPFSQRTMDAIKTSLLCRIINRTAPLTVDSTLITVDSTIITADQTIQ